MNKMGSLDEAVGYFEWEETWESVTITCSVDVSDQILASGFLLIYDLEVFPGIIRQCGFDDDLTWCGGMYVRIHHPSGEGVWEVFVDHICGAWIDYPMFSYWGPGPPDYSFIQDGPFDIVITYSGAGYVLIYCPIEPPSFQVNGMHLLIAGTVTNEVSTWGDVKSLYR